MGKRIYSLLLLVAGQLLNTTSYAQEKTEALAHDQPGAAEEVMRSHNKIYVVMAVCVTILVVLFLYLIRIDKKVSKFEKNQ